MAEISNPEQLPLALLDIQTESRPSRLLTPLSSTGTSELERNICFSIFLGLVSFPSVKSSPSEVQDSFSALTAHIAGRSLNKPEVMYYVVQSIFLS
jgi:hypothetical protein